MVIVHWCDIQSNTLNLRHLSRVSASCSLDLRNGSTHYFLAQEFASYPLWQFVMFGNQKGPQTDEGGMAKMVTSPLSLCVEH